MKYNVHRWTGKDWEYVATVSAQNEQEAAKAIAQRFNLTGKFASYLHIDTDPSKCNSTSIFTVVV